MGDYGIAALTGLLGGTGLGALHGYDAAVSDQQKADALAEQKRQFDESKTMDLSALPPEVKTALGLTSAVGKVPTAAFPAITAYGEKQQATQLAQKKAADVGAALRNNTFATAGEQPVSAAAPGMLAPETRVADPEIAALGDIAAAGEPDKALATLNEILKNRLTMERGTPHMITDPQGNVTNVITNQRGRTAGVEQTGAKGIVSRNAAAIAWEKYQNDPTPENLAAYNAVAQTVNMTPGAVAQPKGNFMVDGGTAPAPRGAQQSPNFAAPFGQAAAAAAPAPAPQQTGNFGPNGVQRGANGTAYNPVPLDPASRKEYAAGTYAINAMNDVANELEKLAPATQQRLSLYFRRALQGEPGLSIFQFVTPEEAKASTELRHIQLRYEQALGGARLAASAQMYPTMQKFFGDPESAPTPTNLRALSNSMAQYMNVVYGVEASQGVRLPPPPPQPQPIPGVGGVPPTNAAPALSPFEQWKQNQGRK